jgi:hypothetical protein
MVEFILLSKGGNFLCLRSFNGEPQYFLSTSAGDARRYFSKIRAQDAAVLGAEALGLRITFTVLAVEVVQSVEVSDAA